MIELGQLDAEYQEFARRQAQVVAVSLEDQETARTTQSDFPHLVIIADADRKMSEALKVIHRDAAPGGGDTAAPTTIIIDGKGIVRWTFRPERLLERPSNAQVLAAMDEHLPGR